MFIIQSSKTDQNISIEYPVGFEYSYQPKVFYFERTVVIKKKKVGQVQVLYILLISQRDIVYVYKVREEIILFAFIKRACWCLFSHSTV